LGKITLDLTPVDAFKFVMHLMCKFSLGCLDGA